MHVSVRRKLRNPTCLDCGYELDRKLASPGNCPECGRAFDFAVESSVEAPKQAPPLSFGQAFAVVAAVACAAAIPLAFVHPVATLFAIPVALGAWANSRESFPHAISCVVLLSAAAGAVVLLGGATAGEATKVVVLTCGLSVLPFGIGCVVAPWVEGLVVRIARQRSERGDA